MNLRQQAKMNMYYTVQQFCDNNNTVFSTNEAFKETYTAFKEKISRLANLAAGKEKVVTGVTIDKSVARKLLCTEATDVAALVYAYAVANNSNDLAGQVNFTFAMLSRKNDELLAPAVNNIWKQAAEHAPALEQYGLTAAMLTELKNAIDNYMAELPKPRTAQSIKSTVADNIREVIKEADVLLKKGLDKIVVNFKKTNPDFVNTYRKTRKLEKPACTTTRLKGQVLDADNKKPVPGAVISIALAGGTETKVTSNKKGFYLLKPVAAGEYTVTVNAEKFKPFTEKEIPVKQGQITRLDVLLNAA